MNDQTNERLSRGEDVIARVAAVLVLAVGLLGLVCWRFDLQSVLHAVSGLRHIRGNNALAFFLAAACLWICLRSFRPLWVRLTERALALMVAVIGGIALGNFIFGGISGYDQWLFKAFDSVTLPPRISYLTALNFLFTGLGLLLMDCGPKSKSPTAQFFTLAVVLDCLLATVGYI